MTIDWKIAISALIVVIGWFVANWLASNCETKKKKLELSATYLIGTYERLNHLRVHQSTLELEEILELITKIIYETELFGSLRQIELARQLGSEVVEGGGTITCANEMINNLRDSLRDYIGLSKVLEPSFYFVIPKIGQNGEQNAAEQSATRP